jgi:SAM-dependent methyltransferase
MNKWIDTDHVRRYLNRADRIPHRQEGERVWLEHLPDTVKRVLDIGTGDGRLLFMILAGHSNAGGIGLDFSPVMLQRARSQFAGNENVQIVEANLDESYRSWEGLTSSFPALRSIIVLTSESVPYTKRLTTCSVRGAFSAISSMSLHRPIASMTGS